MADEVDSTVEREAAYAPHMIANSRKPEGPAANGFCHFCDETVAPGQRFCDKDCRDDFEREQKRGR